MLEKLVPQSEACLSAEEQRAWLRAWLVPGVGAKGFAGILKAFGSMQGAFATRERDWLHAGLPAKLFPAWRASVKLEPKVDAILAWAERDNHHLLSLQSEHYPVRLREAMVNPPPILFLRGQRATLDEPQFAMVGTRTPTAQGSQIAYQMAKYLAGHGLSVISGLAKGIDTSAHEGALAGGGPTLAVVAHGLDQIYPKVNVRLAEHIEHTGLIVSEFPLGVSPRPQQFPRRNGLISALSLGVCVVQAAIKSGSLITARWALEQNREVFAVPGSIHCPLSKGAHHLIRQGAKLVESAADILEELAPQLRSYLIAKPNIQPPESKGTVEIKPDQVVSSSTGNPSPLLALLQEGSMQMDELMLCSGLPADQLSANLLELEMSQQIELTPTGYRILK